MNNRSGFTIKKRKKFVKIIAACVLIFITSLNSFAQYKGAPVKKDRLIKALRSKLVQTRDIVTVINSNGVDFALTPETKNMLIAAGARPEVIKAVAENPRFAPKANGTIAKNPKPPLPLKPPAPDYDDLLEQAMLSYKDRKNPKGAVGLLETAMKLNPKNPAAFQMLGFVNLYGLRNLPAAEKLMRSSIENGGSAVFRVYHDDTGGFSGRCTGSLYISSESIRFESDNNLHTFETSILNVDKFRHDTESNRNWKKHSIFKVFLKFGKEDVKFRFAPISGNEHESKMVERFVIVSKISSNRAGSATSFEQVAKK